MMPSDPNNVPTEHIDPMYSLDRDVGHLRTMTPPQLPGDAAQTNSHGHKHDARPAPRPWPRTARLAVTILVILLAAAATVGVTGWRQTSARLTVVNAAASHHAASQQSAIRQLQGEVSALQARVEGQLPIISKLGFCEATFTNNATGQISSISLSAPGAGDHCTNGQFISVVPPQGGISRGGDGS